MLNFNVTDACDRKQTIHATSFEDAATKIERNGKRNLFGVSSRNTDKFYLDRGDGPLWPITVRAAANELAMGGFEA